jgi:hypothetical protein
MARKQQNRRHPNTKVDWLLLGAKIAARADLSIKEWCAKRGLSRASYVNYRRAGIGPEETRTVGRVTISAAADERWERERQQQPLPKRGRPRKDPAVEATP